MLYVTFCLDAKSNQKDQVQPDRSARLDGQLTAGLKVRSKFKDLLAIPYKLAFHYWINIILKLKTCYAKWLKALYAANYTDYMKMTLVMLHKALKNSFVFSIPYC